MDGIHGWYLQNQSAKAVVVKLRISGFYQLIAPGEAGNKAKILPQVLTESMILSELSSIQQAKR